jgi:hypothetical protein
VPDERIKDIQRRYLVSKSKPTLGHVGSSADKKPVKIVVRPDNIALISPPAEQLGPLLEYQRFFLGDAELAPLDLDKGGPEATELSPCSAFPAGLLPRFKAALTAAGYRVTTDDRRPRAGGFAVNKRLCRDSQGEERAFLRAVVREPLGRILWADWYDVYWRLDLLCALYPDARVLVVVDGNWGADELHTDMERHSSQKWGLHTHVQIRDEARCRIITLNWFARSKPGRWPILVPIVLWSSTLTEAAHRAVVRHRARRVYTLVPHSIRLGPLTGLRLEAMSGGVIDASPAPLRTRRA